MSGGSYDYAHGRISDLADEIARKTRDPKRRAFAALLHTCAEAARAIEWVDSGDYAPEDENEPLNAALNFNAAQAMTDDIRHQLDQLQNHLNNVRATLEQEPTK